MKYYFVLLALFGMTDLVLIKPTKTDRKDFFLDDPRSGTSAAPIWHAPVGSMAKPTKKFEIPKNNEAEPALSKTTDPYDYGSGSGKTYHDKNPKKDDEIKKPDLPAGFNEPNEMSSGTETWKTNTGDCKDCDKDLKKVKKSKKVEEESESFAQKFGLHPNAPDAKSLFTANI